MHARTVCRTFCAASTGSETAVTSLVSATRDVALKTMAEKQGANRARTLLKLTRDLSDERDPARPRRSVPKGGFKAQLIHHAIAATKLVGHDELSADANDRGKKGQLSVVAANFFDTLAARVVSLSSSLTVAEIGVLMAAFSKVGVYHDHMMEVLKARLLVDHLLRESAQPSAIAAICWSYLAFAKHDHDMVNAVHERLEDLLSSGEPLQLNGHGFLGIVDFLCQFNDGVSTSLTERLIEVQLATAVPSLSPSNLSRLLGCFSRIEYPWASAGVDRVRLCVNPAVLESMPWLSASEGIAVGQFYTHMASRSAPTEQEKQILSQCLGPSKVTACRGPEDIVKALSCIARLSRLDSSNGVPGYSKRRARQTVGELLRLLESLGEEIDGQLANSIIMSCKSLKVRRETLLTTLRDRLMADGELDADVRRALRDLEIAVP
ncbi:hypothetical protein FOZ60_006508 [Perkinsus olseni]|uniref:Uncharacterized protein n=1 Tax=Perkinsus olseni TaxID=32597 RepID=A0A7J6NNJ8_PEROL|nr:hypothetical protein FOZ60_006508 [Perkinsus olseni]